MAAIRLTFVLVPGRPSRLRLLLAAALSFAVFVALVVLWWKL